MGYDLHITRRASWDDRAGPAIELDEWSQLVARDPELSPHTPVGDGQQGAAASYGGHEGALRWEDGEVVARNPDLAVVVKMAALAERLGARVQGDDGEIYRPDGTSRREARPAADAKRGVISRVKGWFETGRNAKAWQSVATPFEVGNRVRDWRGRRGTVMEVDRHAARGLGRLTVQFDDGVEASFALAAPGVAPDELDAESGGE